MLTYLLWANTVFEAIFAALMLVAPKKIFNNADNELAYSIAFALGFTFLSISVLSLTMVLKSSVTAAGLIALTVFHVGLTIAQARSFAKKLGPFPPVVVHALFAGLFAFALFKLP